MEAAGGIPVWGGKVGMEVEVGDGEGEAAGAGAVAVSVGEASRVGVEEEMACARAAFCASPVGVGDEEPALAIVGCCGVELTTVISGAGSAFATGVEQPAIEKAIKRSETSGNLTFIFCPNPVSQQQKKSGLAEVKPRATCLIIY